MIINKIRYAYSIIGDFLSFLINNEQRIKNMLLDHEIQTKVDKLPNGQEVKSLLFKKDNIGIRFLPMRIDFDYACKTPNEDAMEGFECANKFFRLFGEIFPDVIGNRIALVSQGFIENNDNSTLAKFAESMGLSSKFGPCAELSFKINTPKAYDEALNSILAVEMGNAKNNKTNQQTRIMLLGLDVNTLPNNKELRFKAENFESDFKNLIQEVEERFSIIGNY